MTRRHLLIAWAVLLATAIPACQASNQPSAEVRGLVTAGPTCPVVTDPPDPSCAERPVEGAVLVVTTDSGSEVARATTSVDGSFAMMLAPGSYRLTPQPVEGLLGTPGPIAFAVDSGATSLDLAPISYDTGIR